MNAIDVNVVRDSWDWVFQLGALFAALGSIAAVVLLIHQLSQVRQELDLTREVALTAHFDATASRILRADELFIERPSTRPYVYGHDGVPVALPQAGEERDGALAAAEFLVDLLDTELLRQRTFPVVALRLPDFEPWLFDLLKTSTAACTVLHQNHQWYSRSLLARYADLASRGALAVDAPDDKWKAWFDANELSARWTKLVAALGP